MITGEQFKQLIQRAPQPAPKRRAWRPSRRAIYAAMQEWTPSADAWMLDKLVVSQMRRALIAAAKVDSVGK